MSGWLIISNRRRLYSRYISTFQSSVDILVETRLAFCRFPVVTLKKQQKISVKIMFTLLIIASICSSWCRWEHAGASVRVCSLFFRRGSLAITPFFAPLRSSLFSFSAHALHFIFLPTRRAEIAIDLDWLIGRQFFGTGQRTADLAKEDGLARENLGIADEVARVRHALPSWLLEKARNDMAFFVRFGT